MGGPGKQLRQRFSRKKEGVGALGLVRGAAGTSGHRAELRPKGVLRAQAFLC